MEILKSIAGFIITVLMIIGFILAVLFVWPWLGGWDLLNVTGRDSVRNPDDCLITKKVDGEKICVF